MKNLVRVEILGREYVVKSEEGEERVKRISAHVNQKIKEISEATPAVSALNAAILAALNIANDYFQILEEKRNYGKDVDIKTERLIAMIDDRMKQSS
jgi:cell division protein ZapA